jgi:hypothetical protein
VTALQRFRPASARLAALAVTVAGAALVLLALARVTVWAPSATTTVRVTGQVGVPVVVTTPEALALDGPSVHFDVHAADSRRTVFVGVGHASDVDAYLGAVARTEITGVRGPDAVVRKVGTDASLPEPANVDVWALAVTGRGGASLDWPQATGRWRLVAAVDGQTPPAQVIVTWQRDRSSSLAPALFTVGGLLLVLGLVGVWGTRGLRPAATDGRPAASSGGRHRSTAPPPVPPAPDWASVPADDDEPEEAPAPAPFRQERRS